MALATLLAAGCSSSADEAEVVRTDPAAAPSTAGTSSTTGDDDPPPAADLGETLDPATFVPHTEGVAWQVDDAVLLTTTSGTPLGHLPGWRIDRAASDRLALPVVDGPDGPHAVTVDGLVPTTDPLPLADRHRLHVQDGEAVVLAPDDTALATLAMPVPDALWVSATGSVVGVVDGDHWDVQAGAPIEVPSGCRTADRHAPDAPTLVCDDGARLVGPDGTEVALADGQPAGWVTVGTTGDEVLATVATGTGPALHAGRISTGTLEPWYDPGVGLFFRSSGDAWVAHLGPSSGLDVLVDLDRTERVRDVAASSDAAIWTR